MQCCFSPQSVVLNVTKFFLYFFRYLPYCKDEFFSMNKCVTFKSFHMIITSRFFRLFNNPVSSVSRWCKTKKTLSTIFSLHSDTRTTKSVKCFNKKHSSPSYTTTSFTYFSVANGNNFPNCVEESIKVSYDCF
jgi:hypothetical protein